MSKRDNKMSTDLLVELIKNLTIEQRLDIKDALRIPEDFKEYNRDIKSDFLKTLKEFRDEK